MVFPITDFSAPRARRLWSLPIIAGHRSDSARYRNCRTFTFSRMIRSAFAKKEKGKLDLIIMSCGSELQHALVAAKELGDCARVVSMPCFERFNRQSEKYRDDVLPKSCRKRVAIEAGVAEIWYQYVGLDGK